jgi:hypothetical protein
MYNIQYRLKPIGDDVYWNGYYVYASGLHLFIKDPSFDLRHGELDTSFTWEVEEGDILEVLIYNENEPSYWKQIDTSVPVYTTYTPEYKPSTETIELFLDDEEDID